VGGALMIDQLLNNKISDVQTLYKVLNILVKDINSGIIEQFYNSDDLFCTNLDIRKLQKTQNIPDVLRCYFINKNTGTKYMLDVETYHGLGGSIKILD
jgi:hypothetical protein